MAPLLTELVLPVAVLVSAAATTSTAWFAYQLWRGHQLHDRALFGDDDLGHPGVVQMVQRHRGALEREELLTTSSDRDEFYRSSTRSPDDT